MNAKPETPAKVEFARDSRFLVPGMSPDKKNVCVELRFLPSLEGKDIRRDWSHDSLGIDRVKCRGGIIYRVANSEGQIVESYGKCPICRAKNDAYNEKDQHFQNVFKTTKKYVTNVFVINDTYDPKNNGKVFLYALGQSLFKAIEGYKNGDPEKGILGEPISDYYKGRNFFLKGCKATFQKPGGGGMQEYVDYTGAAITRSGGFINPENYSRFASQATPLADQPTIEKIDAMIIPMTEWADEANYPSEAELESIVQMVKNKTVHPVVQPQAPQQTNVAPQAASTASGGVYVAPSGSVPPVQPAGTSPAQPSWLNNL